MKKVLIALFCLLFPAVAMAVPVSVDRNVTGQFISPLIFTDSIRSVFFTATSTTATSTFPIASSTRFCLGSDCRTVWPAGSSSGFPVFIQNGTTTRNTGTTTLNFSANSFALTEPTADDNFTIRVSTSTLGLLASAIGDFTATVRTSISEIIPGISYNSGTGEFSLDSGSVIPTTTRAVNWDNAFLWGNHALQGYITSGQAVGTTTNGVVGEIPYWTGTRTLGTVATGTLTENVTGLNLSATRALIGGSAVIQVDAGFSLASTSDFQRINQASAIIRQPGRIPFRG